MHNKTLGGYGLAIIVAGWGLMAGHVAAATVVGSSSSTAYAVSSTDLLQTDLRSVESALALYPEQGFLNGTVETLTDGTAAIGSDTRLNTYAIAGGSVIYTLNTALHPSGYTISAISTYSGWGDTGRVNQHYEVSFRMVGSNTFGNVVSVAYTGTVNQTCVNITDLNLAGVEAIRFNFLSQQNDGVGYKELDVFGSASSNAYAVVGASSGTAFLVASDDLLQTALLATTTNLAFYTATGFTNASVAALTDGTFGSAGKATGTCAITNGWVVYALDTVSCPAGYLISEVHSYSGWDDNTRDDQHYTVSFRKVGASQFSDAITVDYTGTVSQAQVSLTQLNIPHVEAVRFAFPPTQENGAAGYKELDVIGAPAAYTDMALSVDPQTIVSNAAANVRITGRQSMAGTFTLDSPVTAVDTLTHSATGGVVTIDPAGQTLAVNRLFVNPEAGALTIGTGSNNGLFSSADNHLYVGVADANEATVHASITNGSFSSSLFKAGAGTLTLDGANSYSGDTVVNAGTLKLSDGGLLGSGGALRVQDGRLLISGGTAYAKREVILTNAVVEQTAGLLKSSNNIQAQNTTLNLAGGSSYVYYDWFLGRNGTNVVMSLSGGHTADCCFVRFETGSVALNVQTGSALYADQLIGVGATGSVFLDGGVLGVGARDQRYPTNSWIAASSGTMSVYVKDGGATLDTTYGNAVLRLPLLRWGASVGGLTKTGAKTLTLTSPCLYVGDTVVAAGTLKLQPIPLLANAGFELPVYVSTGWNYLSSDGVYGGWTMSGSRAGVAHNGSPWVATAPEGTQAGFLQMISFIKQTFSVIASQTYTLTFSAANRPNYPPNRVAVVIDGATNAVWEASAFTNNAAFKTYSTNLGVLTAGSHELSFVGVPPDSSDRATAIDNIQLIGDKGTFLPASLPTSTRLTVATNATVSLGGACLTVAELNGGGLVVNDASTNAVLTVGSNNASTNFAGAIQGNLSLVKTGSGTLTLSGVNAYSNGTVVQSGTLKLCSIPTAFVNAGFELPTNLPRRILGSWDSGNWNYLLSDGVSGGWSMSSNSNAGIASNGSPWVATAPEGVQVGFVQFSSYLQQTVAIPHTGSYRLSFRASNRPGMGADRVEIQVDGTAVAAWETNDFANGSVFRLYATNLTLVAGSRTIRFAGSSPDGTDRATALDDVQLVWANGLPPGSLPEQTALTMASGATLDLNGTLLTLASLSGSGLITNGAVSLNGTIAPGGTNVIGTLTLAASAALSGTLLIDVDASGSSDLLQVQSGLDLSGLTLQIQDLGKLKNSSPYVIATCTPGALTGRFISTNLGSLRSVCYDNATGRVLLVGRGTLLSLR